MIVCPHCRVPLWETTEEIADEMRDAGWPGFELRRWDNGLWTATFYRYTDNSFCTVTATGKGKTITEAILKAKEKVDAWRP